MHVLTSTKALFIALLLSMPLNAMVRCEPTISAEPPCKALPVDVITIIIRCYLSSETIEDFKATKKSAQLLLKGLPRKKLHRFILDTMYNLYKDKGFTKLILAVELNDLYPQFWEESYDSLSQDIHVAGANTTPLLAAISNNAPTIAHHLVKMSTEASKESPELVNLPSEDGTTPLICAAEENNAPAVSYLLSWGAQVDAVDVCGYTALHRAVEKQGFIIVTKLLEHMASSDLAEYEEGFTPLHSAISNDSSRLVRLLLYYKADPNLKTTQGSTPLILALLLEIEHQRTTSTPHKKQNPIFNLLLQCPSIAMNEPGKYGITPLQIAQKAFNDHSAQELRKKGAKEPSEERIGRPGQTFSEPPHQGTLR